MAARASAVALRSIAPRSAGDAAALYAQAIGARDRLSDRTRRKIVHYVGKAIRLSGGADVALASIDTSAIHSMLDAVNSSTAERRIVFDALDRFMDWCVKRGLVPINPCGRHRPR
jgi:ribosomal 50S subunit-associated protein YjgA (DUF615 family)